LPLDHLESACCRVITCLPRPPPSLARPTRTRPSQGAAHHGDDAGTPAISCPPDAARMRPFRHRTSAHRGASTTSGRAGTSCSSSPRSSTTGRRRRSRPRPRSGTRVRARPARRRGAPADAYRCLAAFTGALISYAIVCHKSLGVRILDPGSRTYVDLALVDAAALGVVC
jgi:hypothetical protein